jgi:hypothetical protein
MNTDGDIECTCDVGIFATCPVCEAQRSRDMRKPHAAFPLSIPPEVIDYWLHNIEVIMGEKY